MRVRLRRASRCSVRPTYFVQAICCNPSRTSFLTGLPDSQAAPFRNGDWLIRAKIEQQKAGPDKTTVE